MPQHAAAASLAPCGGSRSARVNPGVPVPPAPRRQLRPPSFPFGRPLAGLVRALRVLAGAGEEKEAAAAGQHAGQRHGAGRGQDVLGPGEAPAPQDAGKWCAGTGRAAEDTRVQEARLLCVLRGRHRPAACSPRGLRVY